MQLKEVKTKCTVRTRKKHLEPLGSMWASDTILDKDSTALAGQGRFLHTHWAIFKDSCPAFCLEEMHLYLTPPQLLSASLKILGRQLLSIEEWRQYKAPAVTESSLKCKVFQLAKAFFKKAFFKTGSGIGLWISTSRLNSSPQEKMFLYHCPVWPWPSQAQLVPTRYCGQHLRILISQNNLWYY